jgi:DNA-binding transcriptional ArsR family regulator
MSITQTVAAIGRLGFTGNVTPKIWYKQISLPSGRPDHKAITLLSEILYWYRPTEIRDEHTGQVVGHRKNFSDDKLQRSYQSFSDDFGMTKREVQDSLKRLRDAGLITLELRSKTVGGNYIANLLYIEPVAFEIDRITFPIAEFEPIPESEPPTPSCRTTSENSEVVLRENVDAPTLKRGTYTEITTKTSTEIKNLDLLSDSGESNELAVIDDSDRFDAKDKTKLLTEAFEWFWDAYQRKDKTKEAKANWLKIKLPSDRDQAVAKIQFIIDQAQRWGDLYASAPADQKQFQPMGVTWINGERWDDEELPAIRRPQGFGGSQPPAIAHDNRQGVNAELNNIHNTDW